MDDNLVLLLMDAMRFSLERLKKSDAEMRRVYDEGKETEMAELTLHHVELARSSVAHDEALLECMADKTGPIIDESRILIGEHLNWTREALAYWDLRLSR